MFSRVWPLTGIVPTQLLCPFVSEDLNNIYFKTDQAHLAWLPGRGIPVALDCAL